MADDAAPYSGPKGRDKAPKGRTPRGKPAGKPKRELTPVNQLRDKLKGTVTMVGMGVYKYNAVDGTIIIGAAPDLVDSYCDLAERNIYVHRVLNRLAAADDSLGIVVPTANVALAIMKNHGLYDGPLMVSIEEYDRRAVDQNPDLVPDDYDETLDDDLDEAA